MLLLSRPEFVFVYLLYLLTHRAHINLMHYTESGQKNEKHLTRACKVHSITVEIRLCHSQETTVILGLTWIKQLERRTLCSPEVNIRGKEERCCFVAWGRTFKISSPLWTQMVKLKGQIRIWSKNIMDWKMCKNISKYLENMFILKTCKLVTDVYHNNFPTIPETMRWRACTANMTKLLGHSHRVDGKRS